MWLENTSQCNDICIDQYIRIYEFIILAKKLEANIFYISYGEHMLSIQTEISAKIKSRKKNKIERLKTKDLQILIK